MSTTILDSREAIAQLDTQNMMGSIEELPNQIEHAWQDIQSITFTPKAPIRNAVVAGMGGSGLGGDVIKHLYKDSLSVPLELVHDYTLPHYVDQHSLVILASYSGTTEEILSCAQHARERNAQIMVVAAGGPLAEMAQANNYSLYLINAQHNPSKQPRMAIGYAVFGTIGLLAKAGLLELTDTEVTATVATLHKQVAAYKVEVPSQENPAKALAFSMVDRRPVFVASDFLEGAVHVGANQHNENAKSFISYVVAPELNHHLLEGLKYPLSNASTHVFIFIHSLLYHPHNTVRMHLTQEVVEENEIETIGVPLQARTRIEQVFECIILLAFAGFYLAMLEGIDPSPIPFVESFKNKLKDKTKDL